MDFRWGGKVRCNTWGGQVRCKVNYRVTSQLGIFFRILPLLKLTGRAFSLLNSRKITKKKVN